MSTFHLVDHPLITHKLTIMRQIETSSKDFRDLLDEISMLMGFEITRDLPLEDVEIETPICKTKAKRISGKKLAIVPILRAGLGMVDGLLRLVPVARIGHIGLYRDPETHEPVEYYCKMPPDIENRLVILVDPMQASGASMVLAYQALLKKGTPAHTHIVSLISSREGLDYLQRNVANQPVTIWTAAIDEELTVKSYIVPGLGDAGDLCYGEKE